MIPRHFIRSSLALSACVLALVAQAQTSTKDIVLDRVAAPAARATGPSANASSDAMAVSVLLESTDGMLTPRPVTTPFATGDRFRVKLLAARDGQVALYNTNPRGEFNPRPVWRGEVKVGQETITPRLRLDGQSGVDYLHVVLEPAQAPSGGVIAWLTSWLSKDGSSAPKDIRLDSESTTSGTYLVNQSGQGLATTIRIVHR